MIVQSTSFATLPVIKRGRLACLVSGVLLLAAAGNALATEASYRCEDGTRVKAVFSPPATTPGSVTLSIAGNEGNVVLPQTMSADSGRYEKDGTIFWIKGNGATLNRHGKSNQCTAA